MTNVLTNLTRRRRYITLLMQCPFEVALAVVSAEWSDLISVCFAERGMASGVAASEREGWVGEEQQGTLGWLRIFQYSAHWLSHFFYRLFLGFGH